MKNNQLERIDAELFESLSIEESQLVAGGAQIELTARITLEIRGLDAEIDIRF